MDVGTQSYHRAEHMHTYGCAAGPTTDSQITWDYSIFYFRKIRVRENSGSNHLRQAGNTFRMISIEMLSTRRSWGLPHLTRVISEGFLLDTKGQSHEKKKSWNEITLRELSSNFQESQLFSQNFLSTLTISLWTLKKITVFETFPSHTYGKPHGFATNHQLQ